MNPGYTGRSGGAGICAWISPGSLEAGHVTGGHF